MEEEAKERGMFEALVGNLGWHGAGRALVSVLEPGRTFTADLVTGAIGAPASKGAVGALFGALSREGLIEYVGRTTSRRSGRHHSGVLLWRRT
jgi:hypothetical protein